MPHTYAFDPPIRGKRGGPLLRLDYRMCDPGLERSLDAGILPARLSPYRKSLDVENLLDALTLGIEPKDLYQFILMLSCGLSSPSQTGGYVFELSPNHIHSTQEGMTPSVLLEHSIAECGRLIRIQNLDELSILAVSLMRELGYKSYLSTVRTPENVSVSGLAILSGSEIMNLVVLGEHPSVSKLSIFPDSEVLSVLGLLKTHNRLIQLRKDIKDGVPQEEGRYRYSLILLEFGMFSFPGHRLSDMLSAEMDQLLERYPDLIKVSKA